MAVIIILRELPGTWEAFCARQRMGNGTWRLSCSLFLDNFCL